MMMLIVFAAVVFLLLIWLMLIYNRLVHYRNLRKTAFADIDVQLQQRYDLVPQLVETVKGYANHEKSLLTSITEARANVLSAGSIAEKVNADNSMTQALSGLRIAMEAYPDLKADQNFLQLQEELADLENKLAASRRYFNSSTRELNTSIESFPAVLFSSAFGFKKEPMFDLGETRVILEKPREIKF